MRRHWPQDALVCKARLVHVGTAFAWGDHGSSWIDEGTPQRPAPLGAGDADVARHLLALREERGLDVVFVALGLVYGPGGLFERALLDPRARVVGWGGNYLSCVHVDDAARAVAAALERGAAGTTYLAVDDEPMTQRAVADAAADAAGRPRPGTASLGRPARAWASRWPARWRPPSACATPAPRPSWAGRRASRRSAKASGPRFRADRSGVLAGVGRVTASGARAASPTRAVALHDAVAARQLGAVGQRAGEGPERLAVVAGDEQQVVAAHALGLGA